LHGRSAQKFVQNFDLQTFAAMTTIGDRLKIVRGKVSRELFASKFGVHRNTLARWESNDGTPEFSFVQKLAGEGFSPNWLLLGEGPMRQGEVMDMDAVECNQVSEACQPAAQAGASMDQALAALARANESLLRVNESLQRENQRLNDDLLAATRENATLREKLAQLQPRAAPPEESPAEDARKSA
jgi:transcriptional regulator with XRE-family HTH domain